MSSIKNFRDFVAGKLMEENREICIEEAYFNADTLWEHAMKRKSEDEIIKLNMLVKEYRAQ